MHKFTHLHLHTQYSILDGATKIHDLVEKAKEYGMETIALTDHGSMFGIKEFFDETKKSGIKPILGCEVYVAPGSRFNKKAKRGEKTSYHLILLAKNKEGYHNLMKLVSYAWIEGFYHKPRIDKELLKEYSKGLIVSSACLGGEIPQLIMQGKIEEAEKVALDFKETFGDDFYLELMRHKTGNPERDEKVYDRQELVNAELLKMSEKLGIKYIATNDVHFLNKEDADAHDILICLNTKKDYNDPKRMRYTGEEYFKSPQEMSELFSDLPEAIINTQEIADKVEIFEIDSKPIMPIFEIPEQFEDDFAYLKHLTYEGAKKRWGEKFAGEIKERVDFELETIKNMGFPSYFLIVWDFIRAAREMGVSVGPGRGSAAGSAVAYCLRITEIDPIKYDLLFERFLNPDRISMPDIDIDFDEDGRDKVLKWVAKKYGEKRVAHIVTFGSMAPKMAIKDVARVLGVPLSEAERLAKLVPDKAKNFKKAYEMSPELTEAKKQASPEIKKVFDFAEILDGSARQTGVHACGTIIGRDDLENYVPMMKDPKVDLFITQYDGRFVEAIGLLKMDFLGLRNLSIIQDTLKNIELRTGKKIDIDNLPLDDIKTFELFGAGNTTGVFQFESDGMKKHLRNLKPNRFEDLIAMNALYRPGPMEYIDDFIARKHGRKKIEYFLPEMEEFLSETYGITVYQEQVMLLSRKLAGFTRGQADTLRKAMGKKKKKLIDELKPKFIAGCEKNNIPKEKAEKIWSDWEAFASYAFNKSHSTCYAYVAYQTGYLKAHYPAEYMAAVMSRNYSNISKISTFMEDCKHMGIEVLGPDVNESFDRFTVNKKGQIRFGLKAVRGLGEAPVEEIIRERTENGNFKDPYDFVERVNLNTVNKRVLEALVLSGGFDSISPFKRFEYFNKNEEGQTFIEVLLKYATKMQQENDPNQISLFSDTQTAQIKIKKPIPAETTEEWSELEKLEKEKEFIGMYLSAHPLSKYKHIIDTFTNAKLSDLSELSKFNNREVKIAGLVSSAQHKFTKTGKPYGTFIIEDFSGTFRLSLFNSHYVENKNFLEKGFRLFITGNVKTRYNNENEFEFRINNIKLLDEMNVSALAIKLKIEQINSDLVSKMSDFFEKHKGESKLKFLIYDPETKVWIQLASRNTLVDVDNEVLNFLDNENLVYKLF